MKNISKISEKFSNYLFLSQVPHFKIDLEISSYNLIKLTSHSLPNQIFQDKVEEMSKEIDRYENKWGPVDRSEFDGDFIVTAEARNRISMQGSRSLRITNGLLTISRSRTILSLSSNRKSNIHSSTPDLSRSVPNTPHQGHKLSLTSSCDSVLEENEEASGEGVVVIKGKNKKYHNSVQHIFSSEGVQLRRKSEDLLVEKKNGSAHSLHLQQQHHIRQSSDQSRMIPRIKKPTNIFEAISNRTSKAPAPQPPTRSSKQPTSPWGNFRGSNSFQADLNISSLSSFVIPRATLNHQKLDLENGSPVFDRNTKLQTNHKNDDSAA